MLWNNTIQVDSVFIRGKYEKKKQCLIIVRGKNRILQ